MNSLSFGDHLRDENCEKDLCLSGHRDSRPRINWVHGGERLEADVAGEHSREVDSGCIDKVSGGSNHCNTTVLQFRSTEPEESLITSSGGKVERVKVGDGGRRATDIIKAK